MFKESPLSYGIYFQEKRTRQSKRKKSKIFLIIFLVLIIFGGLIYLVIYSPIFKIKEIKISGLQQGDENELISQLKNFVVEQSKLNKFLGSDNILSWLKGAENFNKNYQFFKTFLIKKSLLKRTIEVVVEEREKFGIWCLSSSKDHEVSSSTLPEEMSFKNEGCWWFDQEGFIFKEAPDVDGFLIKKVDDCSGRNLKIGDKVLASNLFQNFLKIYEVLDKTEFKVKNLSLENIDLQEIILEPTNDIPKIYFSLRNDPTFAIAGLNSLKQDPGLEKLSYIDLRTENRVYYKMKQ